MSKKKEKGITIDVGLNNIQSIFNDYLVEKKYIPKSEESVEIDYISTGYPIIDLMLGGGGLPAGEDGSVCFQVSADVDAEPGELPPIQLEIS